MKGSRALVFVPLAVIAACSDPAPTTGSLVVNISGLPASVAASVIVVGPDQYQRPVENTTTISELAPGEYQVRSVLVTTTDALFAPATFSQPLTVTAGQTAQASVAYALASGAIALTISGLPAGVPAVVRVLGNGIARQVPASATVAALPPGEYRVLADTFASSVGDRFGSPQVTQTLTVAVSAAPIAASVSYALVSATLNLAVSGLSFGPSDAISITGPHGFSRATAGSTTVRGLEPGTYDVDARPVSACPNMYTPSVAKQSFALLAGETRDAGVAYTSSTPAEDAFNLRIASAYLVQSVQRENGTIPIVAGRSAMLRVFGLGNQCNAAAAKVKVRFSNGDSVLLDAPQASAPLVAAVAPVGTSWNTYVSGDKVQPGLTFLAEIDPDNAFPEANETDNRFPPVGQASAGVVAVPPLNLTFVPVTQAGVTGDVHTGNTNSYLVALNEMLPFSQVNVTVSAPLTSQVVLGNGGLNQFQAILQEVEAKRAVDNTGANYYGVIRPAPGITFLTYGGMAYVPGRSAVGIQVGWFNNPRQATELVAHELSHSFRRYHSPCGAAGSPDPVYPYSGGSIGAYGYDVWNVVAASQVGQKGPQTPDIMGYCQLPWVSDYTFEGVLNFRGPVVVAAQGPESPDLPALLVTGRIDGSSVSVDPVFAIRARAPLPRERGPYTIEGRDSGGALLFRTAFAPVPTDHGDPSVHYFAVVIPVASAIVSRVREVRLSGNGRSALSRPTSAFARMRAASGPDSSSGAGVSIARLSAREVEVTWNAADWPAVLVRQTSDGALLAMGRRGRAIVVTDHSELEVVLSDGVQSLPIRARVRPR